MPRFRRIAFPVGVSGILLAILAVMVPGTSAAAPGSPRADAEQTAGMTVVGFDPEVAKAHGYEIRTDASGKQYSVKQGTPEGMQPDSGSGNTVQGNCGWSWVRVNGTGNLAIRLDSGFGVVAPVVAWEWHIVLIDNGGVSQQDWGPNPGPGQPTLLFGRNLPNLTAGGIAAEVQSTSRTVLNTGAVCISATHADFGTVF